jgi:anti-sigma regulatory factor (Ser/Thr protein kinase)
VTTKAHDGYRHEALLYRSDAEYLAGTVGFVTDAVALGQPVMVAVPARRLDAVREAVGAELGHDARDAHFVDMTQLGGNPARIIPAWRAYLDRYDPARPVRGIGEPVWAGRSQVEVDECHLHEALLNVAVDPERPFWLRCPYDVVGLGEPVVQGARRNHATYLERGELRGSPAYAGLLELQDVFGGELAEPSAPAELMDFGEGDLARVRRSVSAHAAAAGLGDERSGDVVLAVTELATNSLRHGGGRGTLRTWREPDALVYEVRDAGHIEDLLVGRRAPRPSDEGGRGVWMANQLCDLVQVRSGATGTVVRTFTWL